MIEKLVKILVQQKMATSQQTFLKQIFLFKIFTLFIHSKKLLNFSAMSLFGLSFSNN